MSLKGILKIAFVAAALFAGVQYAKVYVHMVQLKKVMGDEALDARRGGGLTSDAFRDQVRQRITGEGTPLPDFDAFDVTGLGDPKADIVVTARYAEQVDLLVRKHTMRMVVTARADAANH